MLAIAMCNSGVSTTNITFDSECEPPKQAVVTATLYSKSHC